MKNKVSFHSHRNHGEHVPDTLHLFHRLLLVFLVLAFPFCLTKQNKYFIGIEKVSSKYNVDLIVIQQK